MNMQIVLKYVYPIRSQSPHISNTLLNVSTKTFHRGVKLNMHRDSTFLNNKTSPLPGSQLQLKDSTRNCQAKN